MRVYTDLSGHERGMTRIRRVYKTFDFADSKALLLRGRLWEVHHPHVNLFRVTMPLELDCIESN